MHSVNIPTQIIIDLRDILYDLRSEKATQKYITIAMIGALREPVKACKLTVRIRKKHKTKTCLYFFFLSISREMKKQFK